MSNVSQQYLKDKNGDIFSPITSVDSIYGPLEGGGGTFLGKTFSFPYLPTNTSSGFVKIFDIDFLEITDTTEKISFLAKYSTLIDTKLAIVDVSVSGGTSYDFPSIADFIINPICGNWNNDEMYIICSSYKTTFVECYAKISDGSTHRGWTVRPLIINKGNGSNNSVLTKFSTTNNLVEIDFTDSSLLIEPPIIKDGKFKKIAEYKGTSTSTSDSVVPKSKISLNWKKYSEFLLVLSDVNSYRVLSSTIIPIEAAKHTEGAINHVGTHQCTYPLRNYNSLGSANYNQFAAGVDFLSGNYINLYCGDTQNKAVLYGKY